MRLYGFTPVLSGTARLRPHPTRLDPRLRPSAWGVSTAAASWAVNSLQITSLPPFCSDIPLNPWRVTTTGSPRGHSARVLQGVRGLVCAGERPRVRVSQHRCSLPRPAKQPMAIHGSDHTSPTDGMQSGFGPGPPSPSPPRPGNPGNDGRRAPSAILTLAPPETLHRARKLRADHRPPPRPADWGPFTPTWVDQHR